MSTALVLDVVQVTVQNEVSATGCPRHLDLVVNAREVTQATDSALLVDGIRVPENVVAMDDGAKGARELKALLVDGAQVFMGNVVFQVQTVQKERLVPKALLVSVDCLVSKEMQTSWRQRS